MSNNEIFKKWTLDESLKARRMNDGGCSAREIGEALGRSRNSVIGWFHRQSIPLNFATAAAQIREEKKEIREKTRTRKPSKPKPLQYKPRLFFNSKTDEPIVQPPESVNVTFLGLNKFMCKAVIGDANGIETVYCGEEPLRAGHSWCAYHHSIYFTRSGATNDKSKIVSRGDRIFGSFRANR